MTFDEVYARFKRPVWRLARRLTANDDEALDACQEIFLRVWRGLDGFRGEARLSTWVFQIAWNHLRSARRRKGRMPKTIDSDGAEGVAERLVDRRPDPERRARAAELLGRVEAAIGRLPEQQRAVLWLRDGEELSYQEIAAVLDVPIGTVRSRLARARLGLRKMVES